MEETLQFFAQYKHISVIVHVLSVVVGMGAALVSDILFNIFIKDKKINTHENHVLSLLSGIIWIALWFIMISGIGLFLSDPEKYMHSGKFLLKMFIVGCIIINGYLFQTIIHPSLRKINFTDTNTHHKYVRIRKWSFALGAVSLISWLSAFVLGSIPSIPVTFWTGLLLYGFVILFGIVASQAVEYKITHSTKE